MSIVKPKMSEGRLPADAFISFNGQLPGKIKLEIKNSDGTTSKYEPTAIRYFVIDEDFKEVGGIRMGAPQTESVISNVCYGWDNNFFRVKLRNGKHIAAGPWMSIKSKCELYKGRLENFSLVVLMKVAGTPDDAKINHILANGKTVAKVSYHGQTSMAYSLKKKNDSISDLAGHIVQIKSFSRVKSQRSGLESAVPIFEITKVDDNATEYVNGVAIFLDRIEPYIKYIKGGGTMSDIDGQDAPDATVTDFADDNGMDRPVAKPNPVAHPTTKPESSIPDIEDLPF